MLDDKLKNLFDCGAGNSGNLNNANNTNKLNNSNNAQSENKDSQNKKSQNKEVYGQEIVDLFDKKLEFVDLINPFFDCVYKVRFNNNDYVFKWGRKINGSPDYHAKQVLREGTALKSLSDMCGVPNLFEVYNPTNNIVALLKEFIPGRVLRSEVHKSSFDKQYARNKLFKILFEIHERGWTVNDVKDDNLIVTPSLDFYFIDFGIARCEYNREKFKSKEFDDYRFLDFALSLKPSPHFKTYLKMRGDI